MSEYKKEAKASRHEKLARYGGKSKVREFSDTAPYDGVPYIDSGKAGKYPVGPSRMKRGGKAVDAEGYMCGGNLGKKPRKASGGMISSNPVQRKKIVAALAMRKKREGLPSAPPKPLAQKPSGVAGLGVMAKGGMAKKHDDEAMDKALIKKMVKPGARTGKNEGGGVISGAMKRIRNWATNVPEGYGQKTGQSKPMSTTSDVSESDKAKVRNIIDRDGNKKGGRIRKNDGGGVDTLHPAKGNEGRFMVPSDVANQKMSEAARAAMYNRQNDDYQRKAADTAFQAQTTRGTGFANAQNRADVAKKQADYARSENAPYENYGNKKGGRIHRKTGGRAKGKTNISINIMPSSQGAGANPLAALAALPPGPGPMPMPMPPGGPGAGPMLPPAGAGPGLGAMGSMNPGGPGMTPPIPPMRKAGGRVNQKMPKYQEDKYGSGSGLGRLEKTKWPPADGTP